MSQAKIKIALVGDGGVGKTSFLKKQLYNVLESKHVATMGVEVHPINIQTDKGNIELQFWDCAGVEKYRGLRSGYYIKSDVAVIMIDPKSILKVPYWVSQIRETSDCPIILCSTKKDIQEMKINTDKLIDIVDHVCISSKTNENIDLLLLKIAKYGMKDKTLSLIKTNEN